MDTSPLWTPIPVETFCPARLFSLHNPIKKWNLFNPFMPTCTFLLIGLYKENKRAGQKVSTLVGCSQRWCVHRVRFYCILLLWLILTWPKCMPIPICHPEYFLNTKKDTYNLADCWGYNPGSVCDCKYPDPVSIHIPVYRQSTQTNGHPRIEEQRAEKSQDEIWWHTLSGNLMRYFTSNLMTYFTSNLMTCSVSNLMTYSTSNLITCFTSNLMTC